ncbi:MAG TPA: periplasmic heavy metal sensor [Polyangiaceae bacterium]|nr:periplasmic heavy metal sensor [Polyangiaceae bacterium]
MLGFIFGTVCLVALVRVLRHGGGWQGGGWRGRGRRWLMRSLFERLDTTPGQEKAILAALDELQEEKRAVREEMSQTRADIARAVRGGLVDDATLEETFARHDRLLARLRVAFVETTKKVTGTLDERQRKQVGDLIENGISYGGVRRSCGHRHAWV